MNIYANTFQFGLLYHIPTIHKISLRTNTSISISVYVLPWTLTMFPKDRTRRPDPQYRREYASGILRSISMESLKYVRVGGARALWGLFALPPFIRTRVRAMEFFGTLFFIKQREQEKRGV